MTLSLFVYSIAQRRIRKNLDAQEETIPYHLDPASDRACAVQDIDS